MWITNKRLKKLRDIIANCKPNRGESDKEFRTRLNSLAEKFRLSLNSLTNEDKESKEYKKIIFKTSALEKILNINIISQ